MAAAKHRVVTVRMLVVSLVVGVLLAVGSVPYGTLVREAGFRGWMLGRWPGKQRGMSISPPSAGLPVDDGEWFAWVPLIEADITMLGSPGSVSPKELPSAAVRHVGQSHDAVDVFWSGYPWACAVGWWDFNADRGWLLEWTTIQHRTIVTPLRPIWLGLLGNTLVYAVCVLTPWVGVRAMRTRQRRRHGRCVACGYELGEGVSVCPECGLAARPLAEGA